MSYTYTINDLEDFEKKGDTALTVSPVLTRESARTLLREGVKISTNAYSANQNKYHDMLVVNKSVMEANNLSTIIEKKNEDDRFGLNAVIKEDSLEFMQQIKKLKHIKDIELRSTIDGAFSNNSSFVFPLDTLERAAEMSYETAQRRKERGDISRT